MGECRDCEWWAPPHSLGWMVRPPPVGWGACLLAESDADGPTVPQTKCQAMTREGGAGLYVAPDFGCSQFEPSRRTVSRGTD
jgi:hypothetical protein